MLGFILMPIIVYIEKIAFLEKKNASKKREITQIKCWIELSSLVNRTGLTLSTISQISMNYAETRADNSGYTNHRVTCLIVMGSPFDNEQVCRVSFHCLS
jgi:alanine racemase